MELTMERFNWTLWVTRGDSGKAGLWGRVEWRGRRDEGRQLSDGVEGSLQWSDSAQAARGAHKCEAGS